MVGLKEIVAVLNAPGLVTSVPLSFNQLKIEIAKKLHIEVDDAVFNEHKQAIKDHYVKVYQKVCAVDAAAATIAAPAPAKKAAAPAPKPAARAAPAKKPAKKRQDSESEDEESEGSESGSESDESGKGGGKGSAFTSDPEVRRLMGLAKKCGVSLAKASSGASSARELQSRIVSALNKAGLKNTDDPDPRDMKKVLKKQEALADLDGIDPSNIVETSGRPRRAAAAKIDYRAVMKIEGLDSEDSDDGSDAGSASSSGSGSFSGSEDGSDDSEGGGKKHSSKDKKSKHSSKEEKRSRHSGEEKRRPKVKAGVSDSESASEDEGAAAPAPAAAAPADAQKRRRVIESDED